MQINKISSDDPDFPDILRKIKQPVKQLFVTGTPLSKLLKKPIVTIVGSRRVTAYGQYATRTLAQELASAGVVVISGLAIGVDSIAHQATLDAGGTTIAVLPSSVEEVYPVRHRPLARKILEQGGALISEYETGTPAMQFNFVARNRIAAALCDVLLITEAAEKSGSLHTAKFAAEANKTIMAVPGSIASQMSSGTNGLIQRGALMATCAGDVLAQLRGKCNIAASGTLQKPSGDTPEQQIILDLISDGTTDGNELFLASKLPAAEFGHYMTMLEISGKIRQLPNNQWGL